MTLSSLPEIYARVRFVAIELGTPQAEQHNSFRRSDNPQGLCCITAPGLNPRALEVQSPACAGEEIRHSLCPRRWGDALIQTRRSERGVSMQQGLTKPLVTDVAQGFLG